MRQLLLIAVGVLLMTAHVWADEGQRHVLAVVPVLVDDGSVIDHPNRDQVVALLRDQSQFHEQYLVGKLRDGGRFFDVRPATGDSMALFSSLVTGNQAGEESGAGKRQYQFAPTGLQQVGDAVVAERFLVLILHGEKVLQQRWDRNKVHYLEAQYNVVVGSAFLLDREGNQLWAFTPEPGTSFLSLEYPNFDDAHYNKSDKVPLIPLKVDGLERHLAEKETTFFNRPSNVPKLYKDWFDMVVTQLHNSLPE